MDCTADKYSTRVCIIGAGPSGLLTLYRFLQLGENCPKVTCYEKQATFGGQWNYSWKTDTDGYGERVHSCIYNNLWTNSPKDLMEIPEYTYIDHFGRPTPSFITLPVFRDYLQGLIKSSSKDFEDHIQYNTTVNRVQYHSDTDLFSVQTVYLPTGKFQTETFSHVVVASGPFGTGFVPEIKGIETFPGLVLHSRSVKRSEIFQNKRILMIGSLRSAEDLGIHCVKYGADHVIITYRNNPRNVKWPELIEERPMVTSFTKKTVTFKDGSVAEVDIVVFCTGYMYHYPFLEESLRLEENQTSYYPNNLYKGMMWTKEGNQKLFYISAQQTVFALPMFAVQGAWIVKHISGRNPIRNQVTSESAMKPTIEEMENECEVYRKKLKAVKNSVDVIDLLTEYSQALADELGYNVDFYQYGQMLKATNANKEDHIMTYRDDQYTSLFTKVKGLKPRVPWTQRFDDSLEEFLK